jgi:hypothetical protein
MKTAPDFQVLMLKNYGFKGLMVQSQNRHLIGPPLIGLA